MDHDAPQQAPRDPVEDRRRSGWGEFRRAYPGLVAVSGTAILILLLMAGWIVVKRVRYRAEIDRLRASMTDLERARTDEIVAQENNKLQVAIALLRRQAQLEKTLHLSVSLDSGAMYLEREGALLREMPVRIGQERRVGIAPDTVRLAPPRGVRTIARVLTAADTWQVPAWVWADRGAPAESTQAIVGALGPVALLLDGGAIVYSLPQTGPLRDSSYVLPGAIRARTEDLQAILPNLSAGMRIYFY